MKRNVIYGRYRSFNTGFLIGELVNVLRPIERQENESVLEI